nr:MAG TPA: hypothetical protein [Caudoviricetes sp.]
MIQFLLISVFLYNLNPLYPPFTPFYINISYIYYFHYIL